MKTFSRTPQIEAVLSRIAKYDFNPYYQRGSVWSRKQKQLLIDSILRGLDIPKFYLYEKINDNTSVIEPVDGQQRLRAISEFHNGDFNLNKKCLPIEGYNVAGMGFKKLPDILKERFLTYELTTMYVEGDREEIEEMFCRLQNGTSLNSTEKRNANSGEMADLVRELAQHPFFQKCNFDNNRGEFLYRTSMIVLCEIRGTHEWFNEDGGISVNNSLLDNMFNQYRKFDQKESIRLRVQQVFNYLDEAFPEKNIHLGKQMTFNLYLLTSHLLNKYDMKEKAECLGRWFNNFNILLLQEEEKPIEQRSPQLIDFDLRGKRGAVSKGTIKYRLKIMLNKVLAETNLAPLNLDGQRNFTEQQRKLIYERNEKRCQIRTHCDGTETLSWDNWHADHIVPHSKGGQTVVQNGQVACSACNQHKSNNIV